MRCGQWQGVVPLHPLGRLFALQYLTDEPFCVSPGIGTVVLTILLIFPVIDMVSKAIFLKNIINVR